MTEQQRFVKKPVEVEAIQFTEQSKDRCFNFVRRTCHADFEDGRPILKVQTIHGDTAIVRLGDWIVKENAPGAYYPVKPDIFEVSYAPAAALSHAEGEAPVGWMCVDENGVRDGEIATHRAELNEADWLPGFRAVPVFANPAPQLACQTCGGSGLLGERPTHQNPDDAHCEPCPDCSDAAPQVAVPEGWREEFDQFWDAQTQGKNEWTTLERLAALDAWQHALEWAAKHGGAPTAPAGELRPDCSVCGDFGSDCDVCGAPSQQPVSDPGRSNKQVGCEREDGTLNIHDESKTCAVCAPDEREIAAQALDDFMFDVAAWVRLLSDSDLEARVLRKVNGWLHSRAKRLRAGKEGE